MMPTMPGVGSTVPKLDVKASSDKAMVLSREAKTGKAVAAKPAVETRVWNTKNLGLRLASDLVSGFSAAFLVAPIITMIDKAIMQNASGQTTLRNSLKQSLTNLVLKPNRFFLTKPFGLVLMLYGCTYLTANTLDTVTSTVQNKPATLVTKGPSKFLASSTANVSLTLFKDHTFVRLFGSGGTSRPVPLPCYILFTMRDCMTIFASFNVPPLLDPVISRGMGRKLEKKVSGQSIAQFMAPATVQLFSTPIHLLGLDLYNREGGKVSWRDRWSIIRKNWAASTVARMCRIVPAFGVGGVVNAKIRGGLIERMA